MNIIPFESKQLPAHVTNMFAQTCDFTSGQKSGFPVISIKGKVFHITRGEEREMVTKQDAPDEPAASLQVIVLKTHEGVAKTYYEKGYEDGSVDKPTCYSNDGKAPADDAQSPQCKTCAACPHNEWGSRISESGKKGKACADVKRLAVAPGGQPNDPMLLRLPPTSLSTWDEYVRSLTKRGVPVPAVVTKVTFDYTVAHPALKFSAVGFIDDATAVSVLEVMNEDIVDQIIGGKAKPTEGAAPAAVPAVAAAPKPAAKPKAASKPAPVVEDPPAPKPAAKPSPLVAAAEEAQAAGSTEVQVEDGDIEIDIDSDLDSALDGISFDD